MLQSSSLLHHRCSSHHCCSSHHRHTSHHCYSDHHHPSWKLALLVLTVTVVVSVAVPTVAVSTLSVPAVVCGSCLQMCWYTISIQMGHDVFLCLKETSEFQLLKKPMLQGNMMDDQICLERVRHCWTACKLISTRDAANISSIIHLWTRANGNLRSSLHWT